MKEEKSKVDELDTTLYSRTRYENPLDKRSAVREIETAEVGDNWQSPKLDDILSRERIEPANHPFMKKFFMFAVFFFAATVIIGAFVFFGGVNFVSSKNVDINIVGPTASSAGEVLELGVTIENGNNTDLELASFSVTYPQGSRDPEDTSKTLTYTREEIGEIGAGDEIVRNVRAVLLGSSGEALDIKFSVEYKVKGSNATFYKEKTYQVTIGNAPISLKITSPANVTSGETFTTELAVTLNSTEILKNVLLRAEYPYGFSPSEVSPAAAVDNSLWALGDISPGTTKKITVKGKLLGENQDERTFRFYIGVADGGSLSPNFKTVIVSEQATVEIERPAVGLSASFNGENLSTYIAPAGRVVSTNVRFQNNLSTRLLNPKIEVRLNGKALNTASVEAKDNGTFSNNRLSWNLQNISGQNELAPGEGGSVNFSFASMPDVATTGSAPEISLQFILTGTPAGGGSAISVSENRTVKIASQVTLSSRATYSIGPFINSGPTPPKAGTETTYSVVWIVGNTQSEVSNAKVTARLAPNVTWIGAKSFASEEITYDEASRTVTWNLDRVSADAGFAGPAREVGFQIGFTPALSQVRTTPNLVTNIVFTGIELGSGKTITVTNPTITTRLSADPAFIQGDDIVVK